MPGDDGLGFHHLERRFPVEPDPGKPSPEDTICAQQAEAMVLIPAQENQKRMAQGEDFCLQSNPSTDRIADEDEKRM